MSIDAYIDRQEETLHPALLRLRQTIHDAIPEAKETIAWGMPSWRGKGYVIHFAVSKNHVGVHVGEEAAAHFAHRLEGFEMRRSVLRLKKDRDMPLPLIADMARWLWARDAASP